MPQLSHAQPVDPARRFGWIIERDQGEVIAAVALGKVLRRDVGGERPDVPRADAEDVGHARDSSADFAL